MDHWDDMSNKPNSHVYNDYGYWRYVSAFDINTVADRQLLLVALGSLSSSVEQNIPHSANCVKCKRKCKTRSHKIVSWLAHHSILLMTKVT